MDPANRILDEFMAPVECFADKDPKQMTIKRAIVDYVIETAAPLSLVENSAFRRLITTCQPKFNHITRLD